MNVNEAKQFVEQIITTKNPPAMMLWGSPGIGKSDIVKQIAGDNGWDLRDVRLLLLNPIDLRGVPVADREAGIARWMVPEFMPKDGTGILFLDEINAAVPSVQAAAYQLVLDRKVGEYSLPPGWRVIAAGNRINDRGVVYSMPSPLANRMLHVELQASVDDWKKWALERGKIIPLIVSYLNFRNESLFQFPKADEEIRAFPSPRSWEFVSNLLKRVRFKSNEDLLQAITSAVGVSAASEFIEYVKTYKKLPDIEKCLSGEQTLEKIRHEKSDVICASCGALVDAIKKNPADSRISNFVKAVEPLEREYQVMAMRDAYSAIGEDLGDNDEFCKWAKDNQEVLNDGS